jgi:hypothetical protein
MIELSLMTLASFCKQEGTSSSKLQLVEKTALKILVHLTVIKPYVDKTTQIMTIKYFQLNLPALISLKDFLCQALTSASVI